MLKVSRTQKWIRGLLMASVAALGVAALAVPARAGDIIMLDPTGGGGAVAANVLQVSSFIYSPGNALALNGGAVKAGDMVHLVYQAILGGINTVGANGVSMGSNNGNITTDLGGNTGKQIVIEAEFSEVVASFDGTTAVFAPDLGTGVNSVKIYAQSSSIPGLSANLNDGLGAGFTPTTPPDRTLILTGSVIPTGFSSSFTLAAVQTGPPLDSHSGGNTPASLGTIPTVEGSGNTSLGVAVSSYSSAYFLTPSLSLLALNFNTISAGVPFRAVEPEAVMFQGTTNGPANLGPINGTGIDFLFQAQANNDFVLSAVPEPGTFTVALVGIGLSTLAGLRRARRTGARIA